MTLLLLKHLLSCQGYQMGGICAQPPLSKQQARPLKFPAVSVEQPWDGTATLGSVCAGVGPEAVAVVLNTNLFSPSPCSPLCSPSLGDSRHTFVPQEASISCSAGMIEPNRLCLFNPSTAGTTLGTELNGEQLPQPIPSHQEPQT